MKITQIKKTKQSVQWHWENILLHLASHFINPPTSPKRLDYGQLNISRVGFASRHTANTYKSKKVYSLTIPKVSPSPMTPVTQHKEQGLSLKSKSWMLGNFLHSAFLTTNGPIFLHFYEPKSTVAQYSFILAIYCSNVSGRAIPNQYTP